VKAVEEPQEKNQKSKGHRVLVVLPVKHVGLYTCDAVETVEIYTSTIMTSPFGRARKMATYTAAARFPRN